MAFVVQQDTPVAGANSYATVEEFKTYHKDRGADVSSYGRGDIEKALIRATDYLDTRFNYVGQRLTQQQTTEWPRVGAEDLDRYLLSGMPAIIKEAAHEYALVGLTQALSPTPTVDATGQVVEEKREKVGPIEEETKYANGGQFKLPKYPVADQKLLKRGIVTGGLSGDVFRA